MPDLPATEDFEDELLRAGEMLLNGWGYNWYRAENLLRADDGLIRNHAEQLLGDAESALNQAVAAFRETHLPPPTRENPLPNPQRLAELRALKIVLSELDGLRTRLRGAAMPPEDKIWRRHRDAADLLSRLGSADAAMIGAADLLRAQARAIAAADLPHAPALLAAAMGELRRLLDRRCALLAPVV